MRYGPPLLISLLSFGATLARAEVTSASYGDDIILKNSHIEVHVSATTGQVTSFLDLNSGKPVELIAKGQTLYWDSNAELKTPPANSPKKGYYRPEAHPGLAKLIASTPQMADVEVTAGPTAVYPFAVNYHFVLKDGVSGLYAYVTLVHPADQPAAVLYQTRFVFRTAADETFNYWSVGRGKTIRIPRSAVVSKLTDATWKLADGTVKTKYLNSVYFAETPAYGTLGIHDGGSHGVWMLEPFGDYHNGGPSRQGQTVHDDVLLRVLQDTHFGASPVELAQGEAWAKTFGPFLIYANQAANPNALWDDVDRQLNAERAKWPYSFVTAPEYARARGTVTGKVTVNGEAPEYTQVILSDPDPKVAWTAQAKGYNYWTPVNRDGSYVLKNVVPGTYTLYIDGGDDPEDMVKTGVTVTANQTTAVPPLDWQSVSHGQALWEIGTFDRTAAEFRNGDDARGYQMYLRYPADFPNDVDFTIGKDDPSWNWNYAQWSWYAKNPAWHIRFDSKAYTGQATLTFGIASAQPAKGKRTDVVVSVNGTVVGHIALPKTGTAGYRGGAQDSPYNVVRFTFDAALLKAGANDITLAHADAEPFPVTAVATADNGEDDAAPGAKGPGQVMYDAIRLEVSSRTGK